ncbi:extracellular solute-binding protein [Nocardioides mesophilus]|uniref:Extracellular solute-binding protein n=1 Tax=Nocardioides mesophilus TaxID=433659 RepID=A0A7G9REZ7_9ACTN|nr:extracellular solute-binding protein [Nocardioides mesophilus]QNN54172.1 extracellular solute-binding protein [Nocardioides mesophilus]
MTRIRPARTLGAGLAAAALLATTVACAPGEEGGSGTETQSEDVTTDISKVGDVTLTVWDQEVRGGQAEQIAALNKAFQEKYPNVTIDRTKRSFTDLQRTLRNAITSDDAPDVVQANNGRTDMGAFVKNGLLQSLDGYAETYGWTERFPESVRSLATYSDDGATFGEGSLYGLAQVGELVGVFYNKSMLADLGLEVPKTTADFEAALAAAKDAGELPIQFGNLDGWPGIHDYGFVQNQFVPRDDIRNLGFGREGASWTTDENTQAADTFSKWVDAGYFTPEFNAVGYDPAWQDFAQGNGLFLVAGTWLQADLEDAMGEDVGFFLPPVGETGELAVTGGTGLPFSITEASDDADVAAAYIDFITSDEAMQMIQDAGNLPVVGGSPDQAEGLAAEVLDAWTTAGEDDALVPYLDYATPDFYDLITAQVQELGAGQVSTEEFLGTLEDEYSSFVSGE